MKKKPLVSNLIAIGLFLVPLFIILRLLLISREQEIEFSFAKFRPLLPFFISCLVIGYGVWKVRLWAYYSLLFLSLIAVGTDLYYWNKGQIRLNHWTLLDIITSALAVYLIIQKSVRTPYLNPSIRWWERPERYPVAIAAHFIVADKKISTPVLDISETGCFANCDFDFAVGTLLKIEIMMNEHKFFSNAIFVRRSQKPVGVGMKFTDTTKDAKKVMKKILKDIVKKQK